MWYDVQQFQLHQKGSVLYKLMAFLGVDKTRASPELTWIDCPDDTNMLYTAKETNKQKKSLNPVSLIW